MKSRTEVAEIAELSPLESQLMEVLWERGETTAEQLRMALPAQLTDSSVRTLLRRLERKAYVTHERDGRRFLFRPAVPRGLAAAALARRIVASICGGAVESLLIGMVDSRMLTRRQLDQVRTLIERAEENDD